MYTRRREKRQRTHMSNRARDRPGPGRRPRRIESLCGPPKRLQHRHVAGHASSPPPGWPAAGGRPPPAAVGGREHHATMISLFAPGKTRLCDSWTRREILRAGGLSALGLTLTDWFRAEAAGAVTEKGRAKSVILIFNCGAPSHIDLWDPKPDAPDDVRGLYKPIKTNAAGVEV